MTQHKKNICIIKHFYKDKNVTDKDVIISETKFPINCSVSTATSYENLISNITCLKPYLKPS